MRRCTILMNLVDIDIQVHLFSDECHNVNLCQLICFHLQVLTQGHSIVLISDDFLAESVVEISLQNFLIVWIYPPTRMLSSQMSRFSYGFAFSFNLNILVVKATRIF